MTPLATAIQQHENAAGRHMGDDEAMAISDAICSVYSEYSNLTIEMALKAFRDDIRVARAAYAAGQRVERERAVGIAEKWLNPNEARLMAGELTAGELRTVKAAATQIAGKIRSADNA